MSGTTYNNLGAKDESFLPLAPGRVERGQLVLCGFGFAPKGPTKAEGTIDEILEAYGDEVFDKTSPYYTHQSKFIKRFGSAGGKIVFNRAKGTGASIANRAIYLDYIETDVPNYKRDSQGRFIYGSNNEPVVDEDMPTVKGYEYKIIADHVSGVEKAPELGSLVTKEGTMVSDTGEKSRMIPFLQYNAEYYGSKYNLSGIALETELDIDTELVHEIDALVYNLIHYRKDNAKSSPKILNTLAGGAKTKVTLKENVVNPFTRERISLETKFINSWFNSNPKLGGIRYSDYTGVHVYRDNLENFMKLIAVNEQSFITTEQKVWDDGLPASTSEWFDFKGTDLEGQEYKFNILTGESSKRVKYFTLQKSNRPAELKGNLEEVELTGDTPVFLKGGSDGIMTNQVLDEFAAYKLKQYNDTNSILLDSFTAPENFVVDSGFGIKTKDEFFKFIMKRKNNFGLLSTYAHRDCIAGRKLDMGEQVSIVKSMAALAELAPESVYFGTKCCRMGVVIGAGKEDMNDTELVPATYILLGKMADMMSSLDGNWNGQRGFDDSCYGTELVGLQEDIPEPMKQVLWNAGAIYPTTTDRGYPKYIGLQTLYPDPNSVLNNIFTAVALCTCDTISKQSWIDKSGNLKDTPSKFLEKVRKDLNRRYTNKFAGYFKAVPIPYLTPENKNNGNEYTVKTDLLGNVPMTNCTHYAVVKRRED